MTSMKHLLATGIICLAAGGLTAGQLDAAERAALILDQRDYRGLPDLDRGPDIDRVIDALARADFEVSERQDGAMSRALRTFAAFVDDLSNTDEAVIVLMAGHFVTTGHETYLMTRDAPQPVGIAELIQHGVPISAVLATLDDYPGGAVLVLAHSGQNGRAGPRARFGIGDLEAPNGVTIARGSGRNAGAFVAETLARPGVAMLRGARDRAIRLDGFVPRRGAPFLEGEAPDPEDVVQPGPQTVPTPVLTEAVLWQRARQEDSIESYSRYLLAYPRGNNADNARRALERMRNDPERRARDAEEALNLSRDSRRQMQRNLSLLGYDTRGIDGIFGPGTRGAIRSWQKVSGFEETGYLTGNQVARLSEEGRARAQELEREAERKRAAQERRDREFWETNGSGEDEEGLRVYLDRYPDGLYSEEAQRRLQRIEERRQNRAQRRDRNRFEQARDVDTISAYREYLRDFPQGAFVEDARRRIADLDRDPAEEEAQNRAARAEQALGLDAGTRRLIEARLRQLKLQPGQVDGNFDANTRRAIRRYQDARGLTVTGYVDQGTAVRMLADVFR